MKSEKEHIFDRYHYRLAHITYKLTKGRMLYTENMCTYALVTIVHSITSDEQFVVAPRIEFSSISIETV